MLSLIGIHTGLSMLLASLAGYPMVTGKALIPVLTPTLGIHTLLVPLGFLPDDTPITPDPQLLFPAPVSLSPLDVALTVC